MRIAVISDIHGNATALRQVLQDIDASQVDVIFCLGDNIGYGPEPETVVRMLQERNIPSVIGNHELAVKDPDYLEFFNPAARLSLEKTMHSISSDTLAYITGLPEFIIMFNCRFVHGFPPDSIITYMFEMQAPYVEKIMAEMDEHICFIGHTHEPAILEYRDNAVKVTPLEKQTLYLDPKQKYIINAGSVGQPRDGSGEAKYVIFDNAQYTLEVKYVSYDVSDTIKKIHAAGLPKQHALRLLWS